MKHRAYAKVNIFLKIVGKRGSYHEIKSRFMLVYELFDELSFVKKQTKEVFELDGSFGCELSKNTIYKAYLALINAGFKKEIKELFDLLAIKVEKNIPTFAGLGGGSSDAATFLHMVNQKVGLKLSNERLCEIGIEVGADVPYFIHNYPSANVSGIGEIVEKYDETALKFDIFTPNIECDSGEIYRKFRENYRIDLKLSDKMSSMKSQDLLKIYKDDMLNDLLNPAIKVNSELEEYREKDSFFSGSGSSFFKIREMSDYG